MSRFVDRQNARFVDLGPCECPDKPHDKDWMKVRPKLTYGEMLTLGDIPTTPDAHAYVFTTKVIEWSWVDEKGEPVPITPEVFFDLEAMTAAKLMRFLDDREKKAKPDPKPSGARSRRR